MGFLAHSAQMLRRSGLYISRAEKSICFCGQSTADFADAMELMKAVRRALKPNNLLLSSPDPATCSWLRAHLPGSPVVPPPWHSRWLARWYFYCLDPVILFWIGMDQCVPVTLLQHAKHMGVPVIAVGASMNGSARFLGKAIPLVDRIYVRRRADAVKIETLGGSGIEVCGEGAEERSGLRWTARVVEELKDILPLLPRRRLQSPNKRRLVLNLSRARPGTWMASKLSGRRIESWDELRDRLSNPQSILCLGNGPSSEDPRLLDIGHDCLMRVNHRWRGRGVLTNPDMVFVGNLSTTLRLPPCVFGFRTIMREREILLRHFLLGLRFRPLEYFTLERASGDAYSHTRWLAHPTNGAIMIATAVRLRPSRIVISGIDLFDDPRGRYPGETTSENDYLQSHDRNVDVAVIDEALSGFDGSIEILSPNLSYALKRLRSDTVSGEDPP